MDFKSLQVLTGAGGPKTAEQAGPVGGGAIAEPMGDERAKWEEEQKQKQQGYKKGGSVKGWGIARGARKAKMY